MHVTIGRNDDGEMVPADSYQDLCKLAELWQLLILILTFKLFIIMIIKTPLRLAQHSGQHSGPRGGMLVVLSQHTHPAVLASWLDSA